MHHSAVRANLGDIVALTVDEIDKSDINRGDVCGPAEQPPSVAETFKAQLAVMWQAGQFASGAELILHVHSAELRCTIGSIEARLESWDGEVLKTHPASVKSGQVAIVTVQLEEPLSIEPVWNMPALGRFSMRDEGRTTAVGQVVALAGPD